MRFKDWLLREVGTGTACVAAFARPVLPGPIRRTWGKRKKVKNEWHGSVSAPPPRQQMPVSVHPRNYRGANPQLYAQLYQIFVQNRDQRLGNALHRALMGDERSLAQWAQHFGISVP